MLLNKVLFVSLLVLGLCVIQPALGERLATRIAGGTQAVTGQLPFVALIQFPYNNSNGNQVLYQGTGVIYSPSVVITSANVLSLCQNGVTATVYQGVTSLLNITGAQGVSFTCNTSTTIFYAPNFILNTPPTYNYDFAYIMLPNTTGFSGFQGNVSLRTPTSSPTAADIGKLYVAGYGETIPGGSPSPVLNYVAINPERNHVCYQYGTTAGISSYFNFTNNFCLSGFVKSPTTGFLTDACVLDAGAPIFRTSNISNPYNDFEVVGILNFATCSDSAPAIASYLFKYLPTSVDSGGNNFLPVQTNPPNASFPANPRAFDGNFACGDNMTQDGSYEKCDNIDDPVGACCDPWTCQYVPSGTACKDNRNGTTCIAQPRCNKRGQCVVKFRRQGKSCNGHKTKCHYGQCCTFPGATNCF